LISIAILIFLVERERLKSLICPIDILFLYTTCKGGRQESETNGEKMGKT